jgi:inorganic pyrophosphatase
VRWEGPGEHIRALGGPTIDDKRWDDVQDLKDLNQHNLKEYQHFLETYKALKGKPSPVEIKGIYGKKEALEAVKKSVRLYKEKFGK